MTLKKLHICLLAAIMVVSVVATSTQAEEKVWVGLVGIMTGPNAQNGEFTRTGAQLAVDEINTAGGVKLPNGETRNLGLIVVDDQGKPDIGLNAIRKLVTDERVLGFIGPDYSGITFPTLFVGEEAGVSQITSSIAKKITHSGFKHIFRGRSNDEMWIHALIDYAVGKLSKKHIGISFTNIELGRSGRDVAKAYLKDKYGIKPVVEVSHAYGDRDLTASAAKIAKANPDLLIDWGTQIEAALLIRDLRRLGWQGTFAYNAADDIFTGLAEQLSVGVIGPQNWVWSKDDSKTKKFVSAYEARHNKKPSPHSVIYYDAVYLFAQAINQAGPNRKAIMDYLHGLKEWDGVEGTYRPSTEGGDMSTATVIIKYNEKILPVVVSEFK